MDPCEGGPPLAVAQGGIRFMGTEPRSVRSILDGGEGLLNTRQLVVRGTYMPNTVRCLADDTESVPSYVGDWDRSLPGGAVDVKCFSDVRVNAYLLGSGPSTLTVMVGTFSIGLYGTLNSFAEELMAVLEVDTFALLIEEWRAFYEKSLAGRLGRLHRRSRWPEPFHPRRRDRRGGAGDMALPLIRRFPWRRGPRT